MEVPVRLFDPLVIGVSVDLRRGNIGVPEHFLYCSQIGSVLE